MKCPHCGVGIHEAFSQAQFAQEPQVMSKDGNVLAGAGIWMYDHLRCPECYGSVIFLNHLIGGSGWQGKFMAYPRGYTRPIPPEVVEPYRGDFVESCKVLSDSPKASAALSRRCLQAILRDKAGAKKKDLHDQIEEVINSGKIPSHISEGLHAVRNIGNFAAHPTKSTNTGEIVDVEVGEAEWNLDVLDALFDFYFVQATMAAKRKQEFNKKLKEAGKPELP